MPAVLREPSLAQAFLKTVLENFTSHEWKSADLTTAVRTTVQQLWLFGASTDGRVIFHGGIVEDLKMGSCWVGEIVSGIQSIKPIRFRPFQRTASTTGK